MSRVQFNKEFKIQVVKQVLEEGKTATKVGRELELSPNMIARWVKEYNQHGDAAFTGSGRPIQDKDFEIFDTRGQFFRIISWVFDDTAEPSETTEKVKNGIMWI